MVCILYILFLIFDIIPKMKRLLLHICCGPCGIYPFQKLNEEGFAVDGFFYNPNIHPEEEFDRRREAVYEFSRKNLFKVNFNDYSPEDFFDKTEPSMEKGKRCLTCWTLRLRKTALFARENKFDCFTTTLLISPYQDQAKIREIGENISREEGIGFFYRDFREGFRDSQSMAREMGLYRQKYCGCIYSRVERQEEVKAGRK